METGLDAATGRPAAMSDQTSRDDAIWPNDVLAHGTVLNGYRIVRLLGRGGFGVTYLAEDLLGQHFALKEYFPRQFAVRQGMQVHAASSGEAQVFDDCRSRFVYEARALIGLGRARSGQTDIVRVQTFFEANGTAYMVMEYITGRTLQAALREHPGGMPQEELRRILSEILAGLAVVHEAGLMHRDIKPANILLRDDIRPVLIDFGSSREARGQQTHGFTQIFSGGYAPPEQILGTRQGPFSDIYAVGAIGYEAIGGKVTDAVTRQHAASSRTSSPMPPAAEIGAGRYDSTFLAVIDAALSLEPADRPDSASAMAQMLSRAHAATRVADPPWAATPAATAPAYASLPEAPRPEQRSPEPRSPEPPPRPAPILDHADRSPRPRRLWPWFAGAGALAAAVALWVGFGRGPFQSAVHQPAPQVTAAPTPPVIAPASPVLPVTPMLPITPTPPQPHSITRAPPAVPTSPGLAALRAAASTLPCAVLLLSLDEGNVITVTGPARPDAALEDFLTQARAGGYRIQLATDPLHPGLCPPIPIIADAVRRERALETLRLAMSDGAITAGAPFAATLQGSGGGMLQVDLHGSDGMVHHVMRRAVPSGQWSIRLQATAPMSAGQQMLTAIATAGPLDLGQRPAHEQVSEYLPVLQRELDRATQTAATAPRAEILLFQVLPLVLPTTPRVMPADVPGAATRAPGLSAARCADIVARVQLGEALSDADRTALRTQCRP